MTLDPAGFPFVLALALVTAATAWLAGWLAVLPAALLLFTANFFRDPRRTPPADPGVLLSPADGRIIRADARRVSIFMNVFDVHVCRSPVAGRVAAITRAPGRFLAAMKDAASEHNERTSILVASDRFGPVRFTLVAGLIARRIVCRTVEGQDLAAGDRVGIIRFGSRVDLDLPESVRTAVRVGDRVRAGKTVVAVAGR